jgi:hypothetical protein
MHRANQHVDVVIFVTRKLIFVAVDEFSRWQRSCVCCSLLASLQYTGSVDSVGPFVNLICAEVLLFLSGIAIGHIHISHYPYLLKIRS